MKIVSDHGFPKGSMPGDDPFDLFKNERDYIARGGRLKTTVAAMDWAAAEIERLLTVQKAAHDYFMCAVQDEADDLECCVSEKQHELAKAFRDALRASLVGGASGTEGGR